MTKWRIISLAVLLAGVGLFLLFRGVRKSINLTINGQAHEIRTSRWTVSGLLNDNEIILNDADFIDPPTSSWLLGNEEITIETASWITVSADGQITQLITRQRLPSEMLSEAGVSISPEDRLIIDGEPGQLNHRIKPGRNHTIQVIRAQPIELTVDGKTSLFASTASTLYEGLWETGIQVRQGDRLSKSANAPLDKPMAVNLETSQDIQIKFNGGRVMSRSAGATIGDALIEAGIPLQGIDFSIPNLNENIPPNGQIQVVRVQENLILENEPIPYESETQLVDDLEIDTKEVVQQGVYGLNTKRVRVRYEDEVEISRQVEAEYLSLEPAAEIIGYGTKIVPKTLQTPSGPIQYWRALQMYAISYNVTSSGGDGITATGLPLEKGIVAIDPNYIPYGTRMYIPGYGLAVAADTGGGINGRMIDLGFRDEDYESWHQWVTVYFLWPPPEFVAWIIP